MGRSVIVERVEALGKDKDNRAIAKNAGILFLITHIITLPD
jgi:hypothetical protein